MSSVFHEEPFDEGTITKLELFQRYAEEWLPVFISRPDPYWKDLHIYDFFAGSGTDADGVEGSPLRILRVIHSFSDWLNRCDAKLTVHFYDVDANKIQKLKNIIEERNYEQLPISWDIRPGDFSDCFEQNKASLRSSQTANLLIIDQFGVKQVPDDIFKQLIGFSTTDVLFFVSSSTFCRFAEVKEVKKYLLSDYKKPSDYYHAHLAVADAYRKQIPDNKGYSISSFSIKKNSNIYGVIFGSSHPLGMDKFLGVAWDKDKVSGDANFDVHREGIKFGAMELFPQYTVPSKVKVFEEELETCLLDGRCRDEAFVISLCHRHGVTRQHAQPVLAKLKKSGKIKMDFKVPDIRKFKEPRRIWPA